MRQSPACSGLRGWRRRKAAAAAVARKADEEEDVLASCSAGLTCLETRTDGLGAADQRYDTVVYFRRGRSAEAIKSRRKRKCLQSRSRPPPVHQPEFPRLRHHHSSGRKERKGLRIREPFFRSVIQRNTQLIDGRKRNGMN